VRTRILRHVGIALDEDEMEKLKNLAYDIIAKMKREAEEASGQLNLLESQSTNELAENLKRKRGRPVAKKLEDIIPVDQVRLDEIVEEKRIIEGVDEIAGQMYEKLGFGKLMHSKKLNTLLKSIVLTRLVEPYSKRKTQKILDEKFGKTYDLNNLYRVMDKLHPKISEIKTKVFESTKSLFPQGINLMFFDVTTLYFESVEVDEIRKFGYSKDCRFNTTQVVLALATNAEGLPLGYELFTGNTAEVTTLVAAIEKWRLLFEIGDVCFVGDRAMFSEGNLQLLEDNGYHYVVAAKLRSLDQKLKSQILDENNYCMSCLGDELAWIAEFNLNQDEDKNDKKKDQKTRKRRLVASYKTSRAFNDARNRTRTLEKIQKTLAKTQNTGKLITNQGLKKYTSTLDKSRTFLDQTKVDQDAQWDGMHGLITNISHLSAQEIIVRYAKLWIIEESFRINKHSLKMRPIFHSKKERIESHIAICYMAFALLRHLQYHTSLTQKLSPDLIIDTLLDVQASIYTHSKTGDRYRVPGHFSHTAAKIYKAFGLLRSAHASIYFN
jgi:transposase